MRDEVSVKRLKPRDRPGPAQESFFSAKKPQKTFLPPSRAGFTATAPGPTNGFAPPRSIKIRRNEVAADAMPAGQNRMGGDGFEPPTLSV
jgi:hypothetical protein